MLSGPHVLPITNTSFSETIAIASTATIYTYTFSLLYKENFSLILTATSDGSVQIGVWLETSDVLPTTQGSADDNWTVEENASVLIDITDEDRHHVPLSPIVAPIGRLKVIGAGANDATTTLAAKLIFTENM